MSGQMFDRGIVSFYISVSPKSNGIYAAGIQPSIEPMTVTYFKRYKMELRVDSVREVLEHELQHSADAFSGNSDPIPITLRDQPEGTFFLVPWSQNILNQHAQTKWESFREEIDAHVFPCLGELDGCKQLMREISARKNFVPEATWLICRKNEFAESLQPCGTVQGLLASAREGAIQNLGVHPDFRDCGLGSALLRQAILGFWKAGCRYVHLEVTVQNVAAIRLYERFGFHHVETLFKVADIQYAS